MTTPETHDHEAVYDAEIFPLMGKIIEICKREGIPMVATFQYAHDGDEAKHCTTALNCRDTHMKAVESLAVNGFIAYTRTVR